MFICHMFYQRIHGSPYRYDLIEEVIFGMSRKLAKKTLDSRIVVYDEEKGCIFEDQRRKNTINPHATCMANSCQEKVAGVYSD